MLILKRWIVIDKHCHIKYSYLVGPKRQVVVVDEELVIQ